MGENPGNSRGTGGAFAGRMDPSSFERTLRLRILGIVAATVPLVATGTGGCGGGGDGAGGDASSDVAPDCTSCFCGAPLPPGPTFDVTYTVCPPWNADAATADASDDASSDASVDDAATDAGDLDASPPGVCYYDCNSACMSQTVMGGTAMCTGETPDAGDAGTRVAHCQVQYLCGRRLEGLVPARWEPKDPLADSLAHAAWLEAASIRAFRRLARELREHGAPRALVEAARRCARDEARHARAMACLARRRGAEVRRVEVDDPGVRDLEAIARENAVEGCVGETYGALLAVWQAERAGAADVRDAMRAIAPDELRHASLAWAVAAWADARLSAQARERVRRARDAAVRDLLQNARTEPDDATARSTGAPRAADAVRLSRAMNAAVWEVA
jgi:hypothetical protein